MPISVLYCESSHHRYQTTRRQDQPWPAYSSLLIGKRCFSGASLCHPAYHVTWLGSKRALIDSFSIGSFVVRSIAHRSFCSPVNGPFNDSLVIRLKPCSRPICQSLRGILVLFFDLSSTALTRWPASSKLSKCAGASDNSVGNRKLCRTTVGFGWNAPCWTLSGKPKSFSVLLGSPIRGWLNRAGSPSINSILSIPQSGWMMWMQSGSCCTIVE